MAQPTFLPSFSFSFFSLLPFSPSSSRARQPLLSLSFAFPATVQQDEGGDRFFWRCWTRFQPPLAPIGPPAARIETISSDSHTLRSPATSRHFRRAQGELKVLIDSSPPDEHFPSTDLRFRLSFEETPWLAARRELSSSIRPNEPLTQQSDSRFDFLTKIGVG
ncbi:hypothetical protein JCGZ_02760 [Jatropha curcas]|uniref:Uncharacterized protein n=1 Tax=Jatropha curcas TaxID=180498 RepID=A0A067L5J0_JATCU|nr:hypothetical protein JCGZ_02760 [Jatropha curcas]